MNFLVLGWIHTDLLDTIKNHGDTYELYDSTELTTIPFPYEGYVLYEGKKIAVSDYDAVLLFGQNQVAKYLYNLLKPHCCLIGNPHIRSEMYDKVYGAIRLSNAEIPVVRSVWSFGDADISVLNGDDDYIVEKPKNRSLGNGVCRHKLPFTPTVSDLIYQEYKECYCQDERWIIVDGKIVCGELRKSTDPNEFRSNLAVGGEAIPLEITDEMQALSKKIWDAFPECVYTGADIMRDINGNLYVGELNSAPHTHVIECTGHNFFEDIYDYIVKQTNIWKSSKGLFKDILTRI